MYAEYDDFFEIQPLPRLHLQSMETSLKPDPVGDDASHTSWLGGTLVVLTGNARLLLVSVDPNGGEP